MIEEQSYDILPLSEGSTRPTMNDWLEDLLPYFPLEIKNPVEQEYFQNHQNSFITNQNINNDYALLSLHHLFMFCAYGLVYAVLKDSPEVVKHAFTLAAVRPEERLQLQTIKSPFTFSLLNERTFFEALSLAGALTDSNMKPLKGLVDWRNDLAHCNGLTCIDFASDIQKYLNGFEILHDKFTYIFADILIGLNKLDYEALPEMRLEQLKFFISDHYISRQMLEHSLGIATKNGLQKNAQKLVKEYLDT